MSRMRLFCLRRSSAAELRGISAFPNSWWEAQIRGSRGFLRNPAHKAMVWAKEHDVRFPVVAPEGGNPLNLRTRGIPHLFIVNANGMLVEEGHPMKLFTEAKLKEL